MPTNYQGNSNKAKSQPALEPRPEPQKIVTGTVKEKKKTLGEKARELFLGDSAKGVLHYVFMEVIVPSAKDTFFQMVTTGASRMAYGDKGRGSSMGLPGFQGPKTNYQTPGTPLMRSFQGVQTIPYGATNFNPSGLMPHRSSTDFLIHNRDDAMRVIEQMNTYVQQYGVVSLYDLKVFLGFEGVPWTDQNLGWNNLASARVDQVQGGWLMVLPTPIPIR